MFKIVGEIGQNHNGSLDTAKQLVDMCYRCGLKHVKTVLWSVDEFPEEWKQQEYNSKYGKTYWEHRKNLALTQDEILELKKYTNSLGMYFGSSFVGQSALEYLLDIEVDFVKIRSADIIKTDLFELIPDTIPVHISTGMSNEYIITNALDNFLGHDIILYQCTSSYPTEDKNLNLRVIKNYQQYFNLNMEIGLSVHNDSLFAPVIAYALGARWFEYHITLDKTQFGTDHGFALDEKTLKLFIKALENTESMLGTSNKYIQACEQHAIDKLRYGINIIK